MSSVERRILINQLQILSMLGRDHAAAFKRSARLMENAGCDADMLGLARQITMAEVDEPMTFTFRVLSTYAFLQNSFYALDLKEKIQIDHTLLVFPGFEPERERVFADNFTFIRDHLGQFSLLEIRRSAEPQRPMAPFYRKLLALRADDGGALLDYAGIREMIAAIEALLAQDEDHGVELETASAA
jgi:uncharacterized protein YfbU (UPF0304 family)